MLTDVFPALAWPWSLRRGRDAEPPRDPAGAADDSAFVGPIAWQGLVLTGVTLLAFRVGLVWYGAEGSGPAARRRAAPL